MKHSSCFIALFTCQSEKRVPPTFPLLSNPSNRANVFLLSPTKAVAALHSIPPNFEQPLRIGNGIADVISTCVDADLALLELDKPLLENFSISFTSPSARSFCYALSPALHRLQLRFLRIECAVIVYCASRLPVFVFSASHAVLPGWSGSPVITAQDGLVGVLVQSKGNIVHVVPSRFVQLLQRSQQPLVLGYIPALHIQHGPSSSRRLIAKQSLGELRKGDVIIQIGGKDVHRGFVNWQGLRAPPEAAVVELFGTKVQLKVLRKKELQIASVFVCRATDGCAAIGRHNGICVFAGPYKFSALSIEMLESFGARWQKKAPIALVDAATKEWDGHVVVVVTRTPDSQRNLLFQRVKLLDGKIVRSVEQLVNGDIITFESGEYMKLPFSAVRRCDNPL
ncbi:unnamed protein product [Agarophyton chilense]